MVIKSQTEDDIPKPLNKITALINNVLDATKKDGIENLGTNTQKIIKELENLDEAGKKNLDDLLKVSDDLKTDVQKLLKVFNSKVVSQINNIGNTRATQQIKSILDSNKIQEGDFESILKVSKLIANESKRGHRQDRQKFYSTSLDDFDNLLDNFGNSDVADVLVPDKIPFSKATAT